MDKKRIDVWKQIVVTRRNCNVVQLDSRGEELIISCFVETDVHHSLDDSVS